MVGKKKKEFFSSTIILNTGSLQGFTHDCIASYSNNCIFNTADDTTVLVLIINNEETAYRAGLQSLREWNNLDLNINETKGLIVHFRRKTLLILLLW